MKTEFLNYEYPEDLVAVAPQDPSRILWSAPNSKPVELNKEQLLAKVGANDVVVINDTKVLKRKVMSADGLEVLFVEDHGGVKWSVLFPAKKYKIGDQIEMPGGVSISLIKKGIPQQIKTSEPLTEEYFEQFAELALPPYIERRRQQLESKDYNDEDWYQTEWAKDQGSCAAPTASLHFGNQDWERLRAKGVAVENLTLHVGMGTFLPIQSDKVEEHKMHKEFVSIPAHTLAKISEAKVKGGKVWALGTTVMRSLEAWSRGDFEETDAGVQGETDIFIRPGFQFEVVDVLMTNFHQPKSTLLALVAAFAGVFRTKEVYEWAMLNKFKLFSYGDLSVWLPE
jgi:S-adenosylmethionine:tRNA ribosyltransferase-isomerase